MPHFWTRIDILTFIRAQLDVLTAASSYDLIMSFIDFEFIYFYFLVFYMSENCLKFASSVPQMAS